MAAGLWGHARPAGGAAVAQLLDAHAFSFPERDPVAAWVLDSTTGQECRPGSAKGLFSVPADFDAPLPDDLLSHFR